MKEEEIPYILSEDFSEPINVGDYYDVIELSIDQMKGKTSTVRKKMKDRINTLIRNCNRIAGRKIYPPIC